MTSLPSFILTPRVPWIAFPLPAQAADDQGSRRARDDWLPWLRSRRRSCVPSLTTRDAPMRGVCVFLVLPSFCCTHQSVGRPVVTSIFFGVFAREASRTAARRRAVPRERRRDSDVSAGERARGGRSAQSSPVRPAAETAEINTWNPFFDSLFPSRAFSPRGATRHSASARRRE